MKLYVTFDSGRHTHSLNDDLCSVIMRGRWRERKNKSGILFTSLSTRQLTSTLEISVFFLTFWSISTESSIFLNAKKNEFQQFFFRESIRMFGANARHANQHFRRYFVSSFWCNHNNYLFTYCVWKIIGCLVLTPKNVFIQFSTADLFAVTPI